MFVPDNIRLSLQNIQSPSYNILLITTQNPPKNIPHIHNPHPIPPEPKTNIPPTLNHHITKSTKFTKNKQITYHHQYSKISMY